MWRLPGLPVTVLWVGTTQYSTITCQQVAVASGMSSGVELAGGSTISRRGLWWGSLQVMAVWVSHGWPPQQTQGYTRWHKHRSRAWQGRCWSQENKDTDTAGVYFCHTSRWWLSLEEQGIGNIFHALLWWLTASVSLMRQKRN